MRPETPHRRRAPLVAALLAAATVLGAAGCTPAPWEPAATPSPPAMSAPATPPPPIVNDLADGTTTRTLQAGAVTLTVQYWSTRSMELWTPDAPKPLTIALTGTVDPPDGQRLYLSRLVIAPEVRDRAGGRLPAVEPLVDAATVEPGYLVLDPYSYSGVFTIPALDPAAAAVVLSVQFELLVQATPTSTDYARTTAVDTLTIAIAGPAAAPTGPPPTDG